jgi:hypothetical protein
MKYKSKPVEIEAIRLNHKNLESIWNWMGDKYTSHGTHGNEQTLTLPIETLEGTMTANEGDWIIKGTEGEFYPCKDSVFKRKYEAL